MQDQSRRNGAGEDAGRLMYDGSIAWKSEKKLPFVTDAEGGPVWEGEIWDWVRSVSLAAL